MAEESSQEGRLQASKERWDTKEAEKEDHRQAKRDGNIKKQKRETTGKKGEMGIQRSRKERLQASMERWKYGCGGEQPIRETAVKQGEMEI